MTTKKKSKRQYPTYSGMGRLHKHKKKLEAVKQKEKEYKAK